MQTLPTSYYRSAGRLKMKLVVMGILVAQGVVGELTTTVNTLAPGTIVISVAPPVTTNIVLSASTVFITVSPSVESGNSSGSQSSGSSASSTSSTSSVSSFLSSSSSMSSCSSASSESLSVSSSGSTAPTTSSARPSISIQGGGAANSAHSLTSGVDIRGNIGLLQVICALMFMVGGGFALL